jgi:hypothetical protein
MKESLKKFGHRGYPDKLKTFRGGHKIYPEVLVELFKETELYS